MEMDGKMRKSHKKIRIITSWKHLVMFDFDDTLAETEECTLVRDRKTNRIINHLYGQQAHDEYELDESRHYYDYSEFDGVSKYAKPIPETITLMKQHIQDDDTKVIVLTARQKSSAPSIKAFLREQGVDADEVAVFGCNGSKNKASYLAMLIRRFDISKSVLVFEDSEDNIADMIRMEYDFPNLSFNYIEVITPDKKDDLEEAQQSKAPKGEYNTEPYQRYLMAIHPSRKRRLLGLGGNDYLDKGKKRVKDFKRAKSAPPSG